MARILVTARNDNFPALNHNAIASPRASLRGHLAPSDSAIFSEGASSYTYDATACRWLVPPSSMPEDAGAAAELRHLDCTTQTRSNSEARPAVGPTSKDAAAGHLLAQAGEVLTVLGGVAVFGALALFFLVLA